MEKAEPWVLVLERDCGQLAVFGSSWVYIFLLAFKARHYTFLPSPLTLSIIFQLYCFFVASFIWTVALM